jgi:hypothetical protein
MLYCREGYRSMDEAFDIVSISLAAADNAQVTES